MVVCKFHLNPLRSSKITKRCPTFTRIASAAFLAGSLWMSLPRLRSPLDIDLWMFRVILTSPFSVPFRIGKAPLACLFNIPLRIAGIFFFSVRPSRFWIFAWHERISRRWLDDPEEVGVAVVGNYIGQASPSSHPSHTQSIAYHKGKLLRNM
jgi:hypothetical protein